MQNCAETVFASVVHGFEFGSIYNFIKRIRSPGSNGIAEDIVESANEY